MRLLKRNESSFYYLLYLSKEQAVNGGGDETGESKVIYSAPVLMKANVSAATGYAQTELFGNSITYDKVIVTSDMSCPIDENSVLFVDKKPEFDTQGNPLYDYTVKRVAKSLNSISIAVSKVAVS